MREVYLTGIPLQPMGSKVLYETRNYENPANIETCFPIIPILNNSIENRNEKIIISVRTKNEDTDANMEILKNEIDDITENDFKVQIKDIYVPEDQLEIVNGNYLMRIIDEIEEDSIVYADITYGTKLASVMMVYALLAAEKIKNIEVRGIYYGEVVRENKIAKAYYSYDMTKLMLLSGSIDGLDRLGISDKRRMITKLFGI